MKKKYANQPSQSIHYYLSQVIKIKDRKKEMKKKRFTIQTVNIRQCEPAGKQRDENTGAADSRRAADCVWSFARGCGTREQLEALKLGGTGEGGLRMLTCAGGPTKSAGVAQLGFGVWPH